MFDVPSRDDIIRVQITREVVLGAADPLLEYKNASGRGSNTRRSA
jgi:ATP-dependent protease Clp ATPase subunit